MRKFASLSILFLITAVISGCGSHPATSTPEPDKYTGEPTQMTITVQRPATAVAGISTMASDDTDIAVVKLSRVNLDGVTIYERFWVEPITSLAKTIPAEVPAEQGYEVVAMTYRDERLIEVGNTLSVNAPAKQVTSVTVPMAAPMYDLTMPDEFYSGGSLKQVSIVPVVKRFYYGSSVIMGFNPWTENGPEAASAANPKIGNKQSCWGAPSNSQLPEVTKPTKLYYQVVLEKRVQPYGYPLIYWYDPDLSEDGTELPYIWVYPYPGWQPQ